MFPIGGRKVTVTDFTSAVPRLLENLLEKGMRGFIRQLSNTMAALYRR